MTLGFALRALCIVVCLAMGLVLLGVAALLGGPVVALLLAPLIVWPLCEVIWNVLTGRTASR